MDIPYSDRFDVIIFKSVLGGIRNSIDKESQAKAIGEMHKALKTGGELFFAENLVASRIHKLFRQKYVSGGKKWRYISIQEVEEFMSPFSEIQHRTVGFAGVLGRNEMQRN
jgi:SAM-dependent methyltransferase